MASWWPDKAAKGANWAARCIIDMRGWRVDVGCGRLMMSSYSSISFNLVALSLVLVPWAEGRLSLVPANLPVTLFGRGALGKVQPAQDGILAKAFLNP